MQGPLSSPRQTAPIVTRAPVFAGFVSTSSCRTWFTSDAAFAGRSVVVGASVLSDTETGSGAVASSADAV